LTEAEILKGYPNAGEANMRMSHPTEMRLALHYLESASM